MTDCLFHKRPIVSSLGCEYADKYLRTFTKTRPQACECAIGSYCVHIPTLSKSHVDIEFVNAWTRYSTARGFLP
mgnify:CR=1 FL=1